MLITKPNLLLYSVSEEVSYGEDVNHLIHLMWKTMGHHEGIGLAAIQIGVAKRIIVVDTNGFSMAIINPKITKYSGELKDSKEGCLSVPSKKVKLKRDNIIVLEGYDQFWNPIRKKIRALSSFCVQHEIDHLDGKLI